MTQQLTREQIAKLLQVSVAQVRVLEKRGMPRVQLGYKTIRFDAAQVNAWLQKQHPKRQQHLKQKRLAKR